MKKKIGVLTSGGDTPGMNAAVRAVVMGAEDAGIPVMAIEKGYAGLMEGRVIPISSEQVAGITEKGGTILKTARSREFKTEEGQAKALEVLQAFDITNLVVIGGDGSFNGARALSEKGVPAIGIPGTIDNDLAYTDFTIGFDTAVNCVLGQMMRIRDTMQSHERVGVIEVMGNRSGDIALYSGIAGGAEYIIIPEVETDIDDVCESIKKERIRGKMTSIVLVAEGAGDGPTIAKYMKEKYELDAKAIELGYVQRGGNPTMADILLASRMGLAAVELIKEGKGNRLIGVINNKIIDMDIAEALSKHRKLNKKLYDNFKVLSEAM